ncbi:hypothetical protein EDC25_10284 [Pseudofulvimonas gallinarii]|uniref:Uncharacterized protein n=1 Tax=Pseudofulvimonas gallinarii TaxID=634155 RepID=A0A4R3LMJ4_9GAMM|nr:hypothetical protein EDC25_10284 [Pseudofulvimonas gallinarii]
MRKLLLTGALLWAGPACAESAHYIVFEVDDGG